MSVSDSVPFQATIAVGWPFLTTPFKTVLICTSLGPLTTGEPSRAGNAPGTPLPLAWWQAAQFAPNTFSPRATKSGRAQVLFGSSAAADAAFLCAATHCA